jgi:hypothetical protein
MKTSTTFIIALFTLTAIAAADPIETALLTLTGVNGQSADGFYVSPYTALLGTENLTVFCDDVLDEVSVGQSWEVNVYSGLDTTGAKYDSADYPVLFALAEQGTPADYVATQQAMWTETDPGFSGATDASNALLVTARANASSVDLAEWDVLTPTGTGQEFIVDAVSATPEPKTAELMIGAGLMTLALLKRKRA